MRDSVYNHVMLALDICRPSRPERLQMTDRTTKNALQVLVATIHILSKNNHGSVYIWIIDIHCLSVSSGVSNLLVPRSS